MSAADHREAARFLSELAKTTPWKAIAEKLTALAKHHAEQAVKK